MLLPCAIFFDMSDPVLSNIKHTSLVPAVTGKFVEISRFRLVDLVERRYALPDV